MRHVIAMPFRTEWEDLAGKLGEDFDISACVGMNKAQMLSRAKF